MVFKEWVTKSGCKIIQLLGGRSNVFLLSYKHKYLLIDTSTSRYWKRLQKKIDDLKINHIDYLVLTHSHFDHAANSKKIKEKYGAKVIINKQESEYLEKGTFINPEGTNLLTKLILNIIPKQLFTRLIYQPCNYDFTVDEILKLDEFGFNTYIIHTPGHTNGSQSVIVDNEIAIVGDAMFGISKWSIFPPYATDVNQLILSWKKLLNTDCSIFIPSHGTLNKRFLVEKNYIKREKLLDINMSKK